MGAGSVLRSPGRSLDWNWEWKGESASKGRDNVGIEHFPRPGIGSFD